MSTKELNAYHDVGSRVNGDEGFKVGPFRAQWQPHSFHNNPIILSKKQLFTANS